jgi:hypothetical protein
MIVKTGITKREALKIVEGLGYTHHFATGEAGDEGFGSRLYYKHPDAPLNEFGMPTDLHGTVSLSPDGWYVSDFGRKAA